MTTKFTPPGIEPMLDFGRLRDSSRVPSKDGEDGGKELNCCLNRLHTLKISQTQVQNLGYLLNCTPRLSTLHLVGAGDFQGEAVIITCGSARQPASRAPALLAAPYRTPPKGHPLPTPNPLAPQSATWSNFTSRSTH